MKSTFYFSLIVLWITSCSTSSPVIEKAETLYSYDIEKKIADIGIVLKTPKAPSGANIVRAVRTGNLLFLSGKGPQKPNGENIKGKVGADLSVEDGYNAAKLVAANQLAILKAELGDLNKVVRVVKVFGMVNATADFTQHSQVINGFSDTIVEIFGERGKHARAAVGVASLPGNIAVEIDMVLEIRD